MDTTTLTLPRALIDAYAERARREGRSTDELMRDALEAHARRPTTELSANGAEPDRSLSVQTTSTGSPNDERPWSERRVEFYAAMGIDVSRLPDWVGMVEHGPDDGYDSSNHEEWLAKNWVPD